MQKKKEEKSSHWLVKGEMVPKNQENEIPAAWRWKQQTWQKQSRNENRKERDVDLFMNNMWW